MNRIESGGFSCHRAVETNKRTNSGTPYRLNDLTVFQIFSFILRRNLENLLYRPIHLVNKTSTSLQRINLTHKIKTSFAGSINYSLKPINEVINYFIFTGRKSVCNPEAIRLWKEKPSDVDTRTKKKKWHIIEKLVIEVLRYLAMVEGVVFQETEGISELAQKLNIPDISSWGDHILVAVDRLHDLGYGRYKLPFQFRDTNSLTTFDNISDELETLSITIESEEDDPFETYLYRGGEDIGIYKPNEQDYRTVIRYLLKNALLGKVNKDYSAFKIFSETCFNHLLTHHNPTERFIALIKNSVDKHHHKNSIITVILFLFELYLKEEECGLQIPIDFQSVWSGLSLTSDGSFLGTIVTLKREPESDLPSEIISAMIFAGVALRASLPSKTDEIKMKYHHGKVMLKWTMPYHIFLEFSIERWCRAIDSHYAALSVEIKDKLLELFVSSCKLLKLGVEAFPEIEGHKEKIKVDKDKTLESINRYIYSNDPGLLVFGTSLAAVLTAFGDPEGENILNDCFSLLSGHSNPNLKKLGLTMQQLFKPFEVSEDSPSISEYLPIPSSPTTTYSVENSLNEFLNASPLPLHSCFEFLRRSINQPAVGQKHQANLLKLLLIWVENATESPYFLPTTIADICCHSSIKKSFLDSPQVETVVLPLVEQLAYQNSSNAITQAVNLLTEIKVPCYDKEAGNFFCRMVSLLKVHCIREQKELTETLDNILLMHQLRVRFQEPHLSDQQLIAKALKSSEEDTERLIKSCAWIIKERKGSSIEAAQWLVDRSTYKTLGRDLWRECACCWLDWTETVKATATREFKRTLFEIFMEDEVKINSDPLTYRALKNKLFISLFKNRQECWLELKKFICVLNDDSLEMWCILAHDLALHFIDQNQTTIASDILTHPSVVPYTISIEWQKRLLQLLENPELETSSMIELLIAYKTISRKSDRENLWKRLAQDKDDLLVNKALTFWCELYADSIIEPLTLAYVLLSCHRRNIPIDRFSNIPSTVLESFRLQIYSEKELLKLCENYLIALTHRSEPISETHFDELMIFYESLKPTLDSLIPLYIYTIRTYPPSSSCQLYKKSISSLADFLQTQVSESHFPHKRIFLSFVKSFESWPSTSETTIRLNQFKVFSVLINQFPDEKEFFENCFFMLVDEPNSILQDPMVQLLLFSMLKRPNFMPNKAWNKIVEKELLISGFDLVVPQSDTTYYTKEALTDFFYHFDQLDRDLIKLAMDVLIDLAVKYKDLDVFINCSTKLRGLFFQRSDLIDYALTYYLKLIVIQSEDLGTQIALYLEISNLVLSFLQDNLFLSLSLDRQKQLKEHLLHFFYFYIHDFGTHDYRELTKNKGLVLETLQKSPLLKIMTTAPQVNILFYDINREVSYQIIELVAQLFPGCLYKTVFCIQEHIQQVQGFLSLAKDQFECINFILDQFEKMPTTYSAHPAQLIGISNLFIIEAKNYLFGANFEDELQRLEAFKLHVRFLKRVCSLVQLESFSNYLLYYNDIYDNSHKIEKILFYDQLTSIFKEGLLKSKSLEIQDTLEQIYTHFLLQLFPVWFRSSSTDELKTHWNEFKHLIIDKNISRLHYRCQLYCMMLELLYAEFNVTKIIEDDLSNTLLELPLLRYWSAHTLTSFLPNAILMAYPEKNRAVEMLKQNIENHFNPSIDSFERNHPFHFSKVIFYYNLLFSLKILPEQFYRDCWLYEELNFPNRAKELFALALQYPFTLWELESEEQKFYLELIDSSTIKAAAEKGIFEGNAFRETKLEAIHRGLSPMIQNVSILNEEEKLHEAIVEYIQKKSSQNEFKDLLWFKFLLKFFPNGFESCWLDCAEQACQANDLNSSFFFIHDLIHQLSDRLYACGIKVMDKLSISNTENIQLFEDVAVVFLKQATEEHIPVLFQFILRCIGCSPQFKVNRLQIAKLESAIIQLLTTAKTSEGADINQKMVILLEERETEVEKEIIQRLILYHIEFLSKSNLSEEALSWINQLRKKIKLAGHASLLWTSLAKAFLPKLIYRNQYELAIALQAILCRLNVIEDKTLEQNLKKFIPYFKNSNFTISSLVRVLKIIPDNMNTEFIKLYLALAYNAYKNNSFKEAIKVGLVCFQSNNIHLHYNSYGLLQNIYNKEIEKDNVILENILNRFLDYIKLTSLMIKHTPSIKYVWVSMCHFLEEAEKRKLFSEDKLAIFWKRALKKTLMETTTQCDTSEKFSNFIMFCKSYFSKIITNQPLLKSLFNDIVETIFVFCKLTLNKKTLKANECLIMINKTVQYLNDLSGSFASVSMKAEHIPLSQLMISFDELAEHTFKGRNYETCLACLLLDRLSKHSWEFESLGSVSSLVVSLLLNLIDNNRSTYIPYLIVAIVNSPHITSSDAFQTYQNLTLYYKSDVLETALRIHPKFRFLYRSLFALYGTNSFEEVLNEFKEKLFQDDLLTLSTVLYQNFILSERILCLAAGFKLAKELHGRFDSNFFSWYQNVLIATEAILLKKPPQDAIFTAMFEATAKIVGKEELVESMKKPLEILLHALKSRNPDSLVTPIHFLDKENYLLGLLRDSISAVESLIKINYFQTFPNVKKELFDAITVWFHSFLDIATHKEDITRMKKLFSSVFKDEDTKTRDKDLKDNKDFEDKDKK